MTRSPFTTQLKVSACAGGTEGIQQWLGGDAGHPELGLRFLFSLLLGASLLISPFPDSAQLNNMFAAQVWVTGAADGP